MGGNEMLMTPRQMVAFGALYLKRGPSQPASRSCLRRGSRRRANPRTSSRWGSYCRYGYGWWMRDLRRPPDRASRGASVVSTSRVPGSRPGRRGDVIDEQWTTSAADTAVDLFDLIEREVIGPLATGAPRP